MLKLWMVPTLSSLCFRFSSSTIAPHLRSALLWQLNLAKSTWICSTSTNSTLSVSQLQWRLAESMPEKCLLCDVKWAYVSRSFRYCSIYRSHLMLRFFCHCSLLFVAHCKTMGSEAACGLRRTMHRSRFASCVFLPPLLDAVLGDFGEVSQWIEVFFQKKVDFSLLKKNNLKSLFVYRLFQLLVMRGFLLWWPLLSTSSAMKHNRRLEAFLVECLNQLFQWSQMISQIIRYFFSIFNF